MRNIPITKEYIHLLSFMALSSPIAKLSKPDVPRLDSERWVANLGKVFDLDSLRGEGAPSWAWASLKRLGDEGDFRGLFVGVVLLWREILIPEGRDRRGGVCIALKLFEFKLISPMSPSSSIFLLLQFLLAIRRRKMETFKWRGLTVLAVVVNGSNNMPCGARYDGQAGAPNYNRFTYLFFYHDNLVRSWIIHQHWERALFLAWDLAANEAR